MKNLSFISIRRLGCGSFGRWGIRGTLPDRSSLRGNLWGRGDRLLLICRCNSSPFSWICRELSACIPWVWNCSSSSTAIHWETHPKWFITRSCDCTNRWLYSWWCYLYSCSVFSSTKSSRDRSFSTLDTPSFLLMPKRSVLSFWYDRVALLLSCLSLARTLCPHHKHYKQLIHFSASSGRRHSWRRLGIRDESSWYLCRFALHSLSSPFLSAIA